MSPPPGRRSCASLHLCAVPRGPRRGRAVCRSLSTDPAGGVRSPLPRRVWRTRAAAS